MKVRSPVEILLVEDDQKDVELTETTLRKANLCNRLHVARDGEEALDFLFGRGSNHTDHDRQMPYIVLLDLKLPKIDGLELLHEMKNDPKTRMIPVVVLTSSREQKDLVESYRLGVNSYIQKPMDFVQFQAAIEQIGLYWLLLNQQPDESELTS